MSLNLSRRTKLHPGVPGAWTPASISGLKTWLKADAITGKSDGDALSSWTDSSGLNNHALQATGANQPLYKTSIINSLPVVRFDGVNDLMKVAFTLVQPETVIVVAIRRTAHGGNKGVTDGFGAYSMYLYTTAGGSYPIVLYAGNNATGITSTVISTPYVGTGIFNGASSAIFINGTAAGSGNAGTNGGGGFTVGSSADAAEPGAVDIAEALVYDSALSSTDRGLVETYLRTKYAI